MANKLFKKLMVLSAIGVLGLTSCNDDIIAKTSDYDDEILTIEGYDSDIYHNALSYVYDAIRDGTLASDVLNEVLYQFSISVLGSYNDLTPAESDARNITLKKAYESAVGSDKTIVNQFINIHSAYKIRNEDGKRIDDDGNVVDEDKAEASKLEIAGVVAKWNTIEERISEAMYAKISGDTYSTRKVFSELEFLKSLHYDMKKVATKVPGTSYKINNTYTYSGILSTDVDEKDIWVQDIAGEEEGFLHREFYQKVDGFDYDEDVSYVEDEIIPDIYRQLLVEQYISDETPNTLGRSYARKINVIGIKSNDDYPKAATYLMNAFVKNVINAEPSNDTSSILADWGDFDTSSGTFQVADVTFENLSALWKGVNLEDYQIDFIDNYVGNIGNESFGEKTAEGTSYYYDATDYGNMMTQYNKITDDPKTTDTSIESDFTGSYAYPKEIGKTIKTREIELNDYVTDGWYIKSSGVTGLPDSITSRLFNISVANAVDNNTENDRYTKNDDGTYSYSRSNDVNSFVARINGKNYLKVSSYQASSDEKDGKDILFYDSDSKTYYVVQIEEAVSSSKLSKTNKNNYVNLAEDKSTGYTRMEEITNAVNKVVAGTDAYTSLSKKYWLNIANLKYHDTTVYDYFKSNFPDLFD